jgi:hypothetical protein
MGSIGLNPSISFFFYLETLPENAILWKNTSFSRQTGHMTAAIRPSRDRYIGV